MRAPGDPELTAFGAVLGDPARAAALLRAKASAAGLDLHPAAPADLAAAVLTAHCWALVHRRTSLAEPMSAAEASGLAAAMARAAGHGARCRLRAGDAAVGPVAPGQLAAIAPVQEWAHRVGGREAIELAAADMARADDALASVAWAVLNEDSRAVRPPVQRA